MQNHFKYILTYWVKHAACKHKVKLDVEHDGAHDLNILKQIL